MVAHSTHRLRRVLLLLSILVVPIVGYILYTNGQVTPITDFMRPLPLVTFNEKVPLRVYVVAQDAERIRGLSGRTSLGPTEGMLFVFPEDGHHGIWMKDMNFPIDIIWIDARGVIVEAMSNVSPETYPHVFESKVPARYVIETNARYMESFNIRVGDTVKLPPEVLPDDLKNK